MKSDNSLIKAANMSESTGEPEEQDSEIPRSQEDDVTSDRNVVASVDLSVTDVVEQKNIVALEKDPRGTLDCILTDSSAEMDSAECPNDNSLKSLPVRTTVVVGDSISSLPGESENSRTNDEMTTVRESVTASPSRANEPPPDYNVVEAGFPMIDSSLRTVTSQMESGSSPPISTPPVSTRLDQSLEVEKIDELKLSSTSLADDDNGGTVTGDIDDSILCSNLATIGSKTESSDDLMDSSILPINSSNNDSSQCYDTSVKAPSPLAQSLCCVAGVNYSEMEDMTLVQQQCSFKMSVQRDFDLPAVVVSEDNLAHGFSLSSRLTNGRSLEESFVDQLAEEMAEGDLSSQGDDLSPLQHPNPYPIPHLDSPEEEEGAAVISSQRLSHSADFDSTLPSVMDKENEKPEYSAPLFERGISPSSVKQNRSATFSSSAASPPLNATSASIRATPPANRLPTSPNPSPRPALAAPSTPRNNEDDLQRRRQSPANSLTPSRNYDYILKFLLVGDSDVGKEEILSCLSEEVSESPYDLLCNYKTTTILIDGKRVKLQLWDTSGQGRFCTILRSYSRGAQGILFVYDITNKWSFDGIDRWLKEVSVT